MVNMLAVVKIVVTVHKEGHCVDQIQRFADLFRFLESLHIFLEQVIVATERLVVKVQQEYFVFIVQSANNRNNYTAQCCS